MYLHHEQVLTALLATPNPRQPSNIEPSTSFIICCPLLTFAVAIAIAICHLPLLFAVCCCHCHLPLLLPFAIAIAIRHTLNAICQSLWAFHCMCPTMGPLLPLQVCYFTTCQTFSSNSSNAICQLLACCWLFAMNALPSAFCCLYAA